MRHPLFEEKKRRINFMAMSAVVFEMTLVVENFDHLLIATNMIASLLSSCGKGGKVQLNFFFWFYHWIHLERLLFSYYGFENFTLFGARSAVLRNLFNGTVYVRDQPSRRSSYIAAVPDVLGGGCLTLFVGVGSRLLFFHQSGGSPLPYVDCCECCTSIVLKRCFCLPIAFLNKI